MSDILNKCASFELRGPKVSLTRVDGTSISIIRAESDWHGIIQGRPMVDNRNDQMRDLFPTSRDILRSMSHLTLAQDNDQGPKMGGMG